MPTHAIYNSIELVRLHCWYDRQTGNLGVPGTYFLIRNKFFLAYNPELYLIKTDKHEFQ